MIPILYGADEQNFTSNGLGRLADAISCKATEERNGIYEVEMEYPVGGRHFGQLLMGNIIYCRASQETKLQAFRIYEVTDAIDGVSTVRAQHISYQLTSIPVEPFSADNPSDAVSYLSDNSVTANPFTFYTDLQDGAFEITQPDSVRAVIGGINDNMLAAYGAEVKWDMYDVYILASRGQDRGKVVRYGKNITDITQEQSIEDTITGIYPYYSDSDGNYVDLTEKVLLSPTAALYPYLRITPLDLSNNFASVPSEQELRTKAQEYMSKVSLGIPRVSIDVSYVDDAEHSTPVYLCDTVTVIFEKLGISTAAKVSQVVWDVLLDRYETVTVGVEFDSVAEAIISSEERAKASSLRTTTKQVKAATEKVTRETDAKLVDVRYLYLLPRVAFDGSIAAGATETALQFAFTLQADQEIIELHSMWALALASAGTDTITITITLDETQVATLPYTLTDAQTSYGLQWLLDDVDSGAHTLTVTITAGSIGLSVLQEPSAWIYARKIENAPDPKKQYIRDLVDKVMRAGINYDKTILSSSFYIQIAPQVGWYYSTGTRYRWIKSDPSFANGLSDDPTDIGTALIVKDGNKSYINRQGSTVQVPYEYFASLAGHRTVKTVEGESTTEGSLPDTWQSSSSQVQIYRDDFRVPPEGAQAMTNAYYEYFKVETITNIPMFASSADAEAYAASVQLVYDTPTTEHAAALESLLDETLLWGE